ncbi:MAG TPA: hypothetical protein VJT31_11050 [Rugosimonospora sp.]|nr:hypothetical protein [Rugosimonospora sp.]
MNILSHLAPTRRRSVRQLTGAIVVTMAIGTLSVSIMPDAHAESGRRICEYSFMAKPRNYPDPLVRISLGMNYKKDGACPALDASRLASTGYADVDQIYPNPVPKWTCEDWGRSLSLYLTDLGADPCPNMLEDNIYAFFWHDPTTPNAPKPTFTDIAQWRVYAL